MRRFALLCFLALASVTAPIGCKGGCKGRALDDLFAAKPGDACEPDTAQCIDPHRQLWCVDRKFIERRCSGKEGCKTNEAANLVTCDWDADLDGTRCTPKEEGEAGCSDDGRVMARCERGMIVVRPCEGPEACSELANGKITCDGSVGTVGAPCGFEGLSCAKDGKTSLRCDGGKLAKDAECRGPAGCKSFNEGDGWRVECDRSVAMPGDACPSAGAACSPDGASFLRCEGGVFVTSLLCRGKDACAQKGEDIVCDGSLGELGDRCAQEGSSTCSVDGKAMLRCEAGKLVKDRACKCVVEGEFLSCK